MQIYIRSSGQLRPVQVNDDTNTENLHTLIAEQTQCDINDFFIHTHQQIGEFVPGMIINVSMKIRGGKTHGRMKLAGKVKGLTPKVPPQEKPKKKTGRARRREQYAHRFANKVSSNVVS